MGAPRRLVPGTIHHLAWRLATPRSSIVDEMERSQYVDQLGRAFMQSDWLCLGYAIMTDEIEILAVAGRSPLAQWSRRANSSFAHWLNARRSRSGHLFRGRPRIQPLDRSAFASWIAYLHNRPVRACIVTCAAESAWTSHRSYIGLDETPRWLGVACGLSRSGLIDVPRFAKYVDALPPPPSLSLQRPARRTSRRARPVAIQKRDIRPPPERLLEIASFTFSQAPELIASRRRIPVLVRARSAVVQAGVSIGLTGKELARVLGISQQAVSRLSVRDAAEDRDRILEQLEADAARAA
jgi:hypothetical protein